MLWRAALREEDLLHLALNICRDISLSNKCPRTLRLTTIEVAEKECLDCEVFDASPLIKCM